MGYGRRFCNWVQKSPAAGVRDGALPGGDITLGMRPPCLRGLGAHATPGMAGTTPLALAGLLLGLCLLALLLGGRALGFLVAAA